MAKEKADANNFVLSSLEAPEEAHPIRVTFSPMVHTITSWFLFSPSQYWRTHTLASVKQIFDATDMRSVGINDSSLLTSSKGNSTWLLANVLEWKWN
jgi:hypothetical protein